MSACPDCTPYSACPRHQYRERFCEECGASLGTMSFSAWSQAKVCDECETRHEVGGQS